MTDDVSNPTKFHNHKHKETEMTTMTAESNAIERWIDSFSVGWEFLPAMPIDVVDVEASLANQARLNPLDQDLVVVYGQAMKAGAIFPAIVVHQVGSRMVIDDGNHRLHGALRAGATHVSAYVVDVERDDPVLLDMVASANSTLNGASATDEDKMRHAIRMVDGGMQQAAAARLCGIKVGTLNNQLRAERVSRKFDRMGLGRQGRKMPQHHLIAAESAIDLLDVEGAGLLIAASLCAKNRDDFRRLTRELPEFPAVSDRCEFIQMFIDERNSINAPTNTKKAASMEPWKAFKLHASALAKETPESIIATCPPEQKEALIRLADDIRFIASKVSVQ